MRIYRYQDENYPCDLPITEIWMLEDYPNSPMSNTPGLTLHEYEVAHDKEHGCPPRHLPEEERNFIPYISTIVDNFGRSSDYHRIKFEKMYRVHYYEVESLEEFLLDNPDFEVSSHLGYIFERTWLD